MVAGLGRPETVAEPRRQGPGVGGLGRHPLGGVREAPHAVRVGQPRLPGPRHLLHQKLRTRPVQHERAEAARAAPPRRHARFRIRGSQKRLVRCERCTLRVSTASARRSRPARWHGVAFMRRAHGAAGDRARLADACPLVAGQGRFACAAAAEEAESSGRAPRSLDRGGIDRLPRRQNSGSHGKPVGSRCCRPFTVAIGTFWRRAMCPRKRAASRDGACARARNQDPPGTTRRGEIQREEHAANTRDVLNSVSLWSVSASCGGCANLPHASNLAGSSTSRELPWGTMSPRGDPATTRSTQQPSHCGRGHAPHGDARATLATPAKTLPGLDAARAVTAPALAAVQTRRECTRRRRSVALGSPPRDAIVGGTTGGDRQRAGVMASVGSTRARDILSLHAEPERARRMLIKLALMRMTAEGGEGSTRGCGRAVLDWLWPFDCAVRPALLGTIAQAAAAALTPERVAEPGRELLASVADAFARAGHERAPGVAPSTCASSRRRERSADAPRRASAGKNLGHRELHGPKAALPI